MTNGNYRPSGVGPLCLTFFNDDGLVNKQTHFVELTFGRELLDGGSKQECIEQSFHQVSNGYKHSLVLNLNYVDEIHPLFFFLFVDSFLSQIKLKPAAIKEKERWERFARCGGAGFPREQWGQRKFR